MKIFTLFAIVTLLTSCIGMHASDNQEIELKNNMLEYEFYEEYENNHAVMTLKSEIKAWNDLSADMRSSTIQKMINAHEHGSMAGYPEVLNCCKNKGQALQQILAAPTLSEQNDLIVSNAQNCYAWQIVITNHSEKVTKQK